MNNKYNMLWFYNIKSNNNNPFNFYQVFVENRLVYSDEDSNFIYSFDSTDLSKFNLNLVNCNQDNIICDIKMMDCVVSYNILSTNINSNFNNKNYVFMTKSNFIKPNDNKCNLPIFSHSYKITSSKRLPNLIHSEYDCVLTLNFQIYKLDKVIKIQFIVESNSKTNLTRKYFLTTNLDFIEPFVKKN